MSDDPRPGGRWQVTATEMQIKSSAVQTAEDEVPPLQNHSKPGPLVPQALSLSLARENRVHRLHQEVTLSVLQRNLTDYDSNNTIKRRVQKPDY